MRALACAAVLLASALATSACGGGRVEPTGSSTTNGTKTDAVELHDSTDGVLPPSLRSFVHSLEAGSPDGSVTEIDVYGPGSRTALVKASSGDIVAESARERDESFYLIVLHGRFVCNGCTGPAGHKPPRGTIETRVWSQAEGGTDFGIADSLPAAVSSLHRLAVVTLS